MRVCGIELSSSDAILCVLDGICDDYSVVEIGQPKLTITDTHSADEVQNFRKAFEAVLRDYHIERVAIKRRAERGRYTGSAASFKLEGLIQLSSVPVVIIPPQTVKAICRKQTPEQPPELNKYQCEAFLTAYSQLPARTDD